MDETIELAPLGALPQGAPVATPESAPVAVPAGMLPPVPRSIDPTSRDLIANVSHELRTPVTALQAQLENMADGVTPATPATLNAALDHTARLTRLIAYLLDLSRQDAGASGLDMTVIPVGDFLEDCAHELAMTDAAKDLRYLVEVAPDDLTVVADEERIRQIILNLVTNAIKHSPRGGRITLAAQRTPCNTGTWVDVSDEGPGIPEEERAQVFERFNTGSRPRGSGGTGIGLAIVRWAAELHGGTVEVVDAPVGSGATVRLSLPDLAA
ncbi:MAG: HAMP domain-containing histidine kinase [Cellulomonadaceae bacterium]|jgi:signal transduction histidine kinase|nr:HAMP domain-containing histidine kinase [Cellulomonadaceae bacterium]